MYVLLCINIFYVYVYIYIYIRMYQALLLFMAELNSIPLWGSIPFVSSHVSIDIWVFPL